MAFNHSNKCDCPVGCCFCGPSYDKDLIVAYDCVKDEIFLYDRTNSSTYPDIVLREIDSIILGTLTGQEYKGSNSYEKNKDQIVTEEAIGVKDE